MDKQILAVDRNMDNFNNHKDTWQSHGIRPVRVTSMQEAIEALIREEFILIGINGDTINYKPSLSVLRDNTLSPILIFSSHFSFENQVDAISKGADYYVLRHENSEETTTMSIALLQRYLDNLHRARKRSKVLSYNEVFICLHERKVFVRDMELSLTRKEFDLLCMLISSPKRVFTYEQILRRVWGDDYIDSDNTVLWSEVKRLRKKLREATVTSDYIKTMRDFGYSFDG